MNINKKLQASRSRLKIVPGTIPVVENNDKLVALEESKYIKIIPIWEEVLDPFEGKAYQAYIKKHPKYTHIYMRSKVKDMLLEAAKNLPENWQLVVRAAHRPLEVQQHLFNALCADIEEQNPKLSKEEILNQARDFVSDPSQKVPPHSSGAAVDVDVIDNKTGKLVDFGCEVNTSDETAFIHTKSISKRAQKNRQILLVTMLCSGFASLYTEWWHYSYGDQNWASFYGEKKAIYGFAEPEV